MCLLSLYGFADRLSTSKLPRKGRKEEETEQKEKLNLFTLTLSTPRSQNLSATNYENDLSKPLYPIYLSQPPTYLTQ
jgi:hypothetical protein